MAQIVNTNIPSLFAQRQLTKTGSALETSLQRLSSGLRINSAKDDAAGLAISTRFSAQIRGLDMAGRNANDGVSLAQTAEAGLEEMTSNLQRLRELSVQASNGSLSAADRGSLNDEAKQIISEMGRISDTTQFNGIKLLDGTAKDLTLQVGSNAHESFKFTVDGARTDQLGVMQTTSTSSSTYYGETNSESALQQGDLVINGVTIGASHSIYDTASTTNQSASAIAKTKAINLQSATTGVTAQVNDTRAEGNSMTALGASTSGTVTINGVTVTVTAVLGDNAATRQAVVGAINAKSGQTGVVAQDTGDDSKGVQLTAADGRNIDVTVGVVASTAIGVKTDVTYGTYTLSSDKAITLGEGLGGRIERSGLRAGSYDKGVATLSAAGNNSTAIAAGDFAINGVLVGASRPTDDAASNTGQSASAFVKTAAINRISSQTGVTATVDTNTARGNTMTAAAMSGNMTINGITTANFVTTTDAAHSRAVTVAAINEISARTGVVAVDTGDNTTGVNLVAADGRNIDASVSGGMTSAASGILTATNYGGYTLHSSKAITIGAGTTGDEENGGFSLGTFGKGESGTAIKDVDISTVAGAQAAISAADNALESINSNRSNLGAVQNRLTSTISQLASASESFSASRSRILDADFAKETAALTKAQVMQQAGVAMLAQAKALPQQVMSLLQG